MALVTGSATGVGRSTALRLADRGYDIVVNYSRSEAEANETAELVRKRQRQVLVVRCNVADDAKVRSMFQQCFDEFGRLDVLVNNAATTHFVSLGDLEGLTEAMWDDILAVNLKGAFFCSRAAVPLMRQTGGGSIVSVASVAGITGNGSSLAYCASKAGLICMTKSLATALAPDIRVNAVCPGPIISRWLADHQDMIDRALQETPLKKASMPEDIAQTCEFLACDAQLMTGQAVVVDGGRTM